MPGPQSTLPVLLSFVAQSLYNNGVICLMLGIHNPCSDSAANPGQVLSAGITEMGTMWLFIQKILAQVQGPKQMMLTAWREMPQQRLWGGREHLLVPQEVMALREFKDEEELVRWRSANIIMADAPSTPKR